MKRVTQASGMLAVALMAAIQMAAADTMFLPFATKTSYGTTVIVVPKCGAIARDGMNCELFTLTLVPQQTADGTAEQCVILMSSEAVLFRPTNGRTWVGKVAKPACRSTTTMTLSRLDNYREPSRLRLRIDFSSADPSPECRSVMEEAQPLVFDWQAGKPVEIDQQCQGLLMGPGAAPRFILEGP